MQKLCLYMKLLQHKKICTQTVQTLPRLQHCVTDRRCIAGEKRCPPLPLWRENSEIQTKSSVNVNCKKIKQATVKNQFKSSAKLPTQTRKVLHDHKHVS